MDNQNSTHPHTEETGNIPLTPEEREVYNNLIKDAYPQPKKSIAAEVMKQINAETERKAAKIVRMNRLVRYGSIAACFVLILGVVLGIGPYLNRSLKDESAPEAAFYNSADMEALSAGAPAEYDLMKDDRALENEAPAEAGIEYSFTCEDAIDVYTTADKAEAETVFFCEAHTYAAYHTISDELQNYVGAEAFTRWLNLEEALDECGCPSVKTFVRHFGITEEAFREITASGNVNYDIAAIYENK